MKTKRHAKILELIQEHNIDTQEELLKRLKNAGFDVTQATISRDIKELRLVKSLANDGRYKYSTGKNEATDISAKFFTLFSDSVLSIDFAGNMVAVKMCIRDSDRTGAAFLSAWTGRIGSGCMQGDGI